MKKKALIIFAREPKPGKVKTRLQKDLPARTVLAIYKAFLKDILAMVGKVPGVQPFIFYAGSGSSIPFLRKYEGRFILKRQTGRDLGIRISRAFSLCSRLGYEKILIIGTDCLTIDRALVKRAFGKLEQFDGVLGPARDGGYYLVGLNSPLPALFKNINWSTEKVLTQTLKRARVLRKCIYLLPVKEDIDTLKSLMRLAKDTSSFMRRRTHTQKMLKNGLR